MSFKLVSPFRNYRICIERQFRNKAWQFKEASEIKTAESESIRQQPIKYSTSEAAAWKAAYSTSGEEYFKTPKIQPLVVVMSFSVFLVYFCILREENDLDEWLKSLENTIPLQLEEAQLRAEIEHGKKNGSNVKWKEGRLKEVIIQREKLTKNV